MNNKGVILNMTANVLAFGLSIVISFFLTPYITKNVGIEAYGLVGLANSFTSYILVITTALNSMASRFIIIELYRKNIDKANSYFSSVLLANTAFALVLTIPSIWLILNINILKISPNLILDAQLTFAFILLGFLVNLIGAFYGIVLYAKNILWKGSFRVTESYLIRLILIFLLFTLLSPKIYYVVLATFIASLYPLIFNIHYTRVLIPELKVRKKWFSVKAIKDLLFSGIWNSITKLSQILLDGVDLLLCNLFINGVMTGYVSIAKTIPALYTGLVAVLSDSFYPKFLEYYSKNQEEELFAEIRKSINVLSAISGICLSLLLVYSKEFYSLWLPNCDSSLLQTLTILATGTILISGCVYSLFSVFSLTNKVRYNSIALLITGILSVVTTIICLKFTNLGVYAIVGISSIFGIVRNLGFTPIYAAKCLGLPFYTFYPVLFRNLINIICLILICIGIKQLIPSNNWSGLFLNGLINVIIGATTTAFILFSKEERKYLLNSVYNLFSIYVEK